MAVRAQAGATRGEASRGAPSFRLRLRLDFKGELGARSAPSYFLKSSLSLSLNDEEHPERASSSSASARANCRWGPEKCNLKPSLGLGLGFF